MWQPLCLVLLLLAQCPLTVQDGGQSPQPLSRVGNPQGSGCTWGATPGCAPTWALLRAGQGAPGWHRDRGQRALMAFPSVGISPQGWISSQTSESLCWQPGRTPSPAQPCSPVSPQAGGAPRAAPTCRDEEDAGAEDDVVFALVELAGGHAQAPEEQQPHAEDGEDAGRSHRTCGWERGSISPQHPCTSA